jgi:hypothetical protein
MLESTADFNRRQKISYLKSWMPLMLAEVLASKLSQAVVKDLVRHLQDDRWADLEAERRKIAAMKPAERSKYLAEYKPEEVHSHEVGTTVKPGPVHPGPVDGGTGG